MSMSNIFGGMLAGVGQGYEEIQDRKHKEKREDQKAQRDAAVKMMGDKDLPPSERAYWRKVWLKTHGIADESKAPPQLTQILDSHMGAASPHPLAATPPPQMQEIGLPSEPRPLEKRAAVPPPSPESVAAPEASQELRIPTLREFAKTRGIPFNENDPDADFNLEHTPGLITAYNSHVGRLETFEERRQSALAAAAERKAALADRPPPQPSAGMSPEAEAQWKRLHPEKDRKKSFEEETFNDFVTNPQIKGYTKDRTGFLKWKADLNNETGGGESFTPEALDMIAHSVASGAPMPAFGMGKASTAARMMVWNRAAQLNPKLDLASATAGYSADKGSLAQLQRGRDAIVAFENTAGKNLDLFLSTTKGVIDSGSPLINRPLRAITQQGLGGKELAAFNAARQIALNEVAKVTSNPNLTGQLSDSARKEIEAILSPTATLKQIYDVVAILKTDMNNRKVSMDEQIGAIKGRIGGGTNAATPPPSPNGKQNDPLGIR